MRLVLEKKCKIVVDRFNAKVYDNGEYYTQIPVGKDCDISIGEYTGIAVIDYINYKDTKTGQFKSFMVLADIK